MALLDFKLTSSGDLEINTLAQPTKLYGQDAINQLVRAALSLWKGNWYDDLDRGVDWLNVTKMLFSRAEIIDIITNAILKVAYITEVVDVSIDNNNSTRTAQITYTVQALKSNITGSEVL